jgi:uncharacterized FlaG/YvyC family protein
MSENSINPISSIRATEISQPVRISAPAQTEFAPHPNPSQTKPAAAAQEKHQKPKENELSLGNELSNVSIYFRIDDKTHDLTVFLVDRKSKQVLRSIPASELHKLQAGDLLKLTA